MSDVVPRDKNRVAIPNLNIEIAKSSLSGYSYIHKFGRAPDFDTADGFVDIWDGANNASPNLMSYTFSTTADIDSLSSSDDTDTQDIEVQGLDSNYNLVVQTITLTGQTRVALTTDLIRVFRLTNRGSTDLSGTCYCFKNVATTGGVPNTLANIRAMITIGNNQTLMAIYTIPNGKTGYLQSWYASLSKRQTAICTAKLLTRSTGEVFQLKHISDIHNTGTSSVQYIYQVPEKLEAKTDIKMQADSSANAQGVSAGFDIILVDN